MKRVHVLFVCLGNVCRSPMAEALARKYGSDVLRASSAGVTPLTRSHAPTEAILREINIDPGEHKPRALRDLDLSHYDLIVNMSGMPLSDTAEVPVENWTVRDPYGCSEEEFRRARGEIEMLVMNLILRLRTGKLPNLSKKRVRAFDSMRPGSRK